MVIFLLYNVNRKEVLWLTFLEKLDYLMKKEHLNKRNVSQGSGIPYSTIDGFYKQGYKNIKLSTFRKLCDYFGVTMDSMARDDVEFPEKYESVVKGIHMTNEERFLVTCYRKADTLDKELALRALHVREKGDTEKMA